MSQIEMDDAYDARLLEALRELERTSHSDQSRHLFDVYNEGFPVRETSHMCGGCVRRVLDRVRAHLREKGVLVS